MLLRVRSNRGFIKSLGIQESRSNKEMFHLLDLHVLRKISTIVETGD